MEFKISNFNIMSDKHFDFFTWDEVKDGEPEVSRDKRYDQVMKVIDDINEIEKIDVMTFQEVTSNSIGYLAEYAKKNNYKLYQNENKSEDKPILLVTMIKNDLVNAVADNIVDLTDNYQNFYNKKNYHSDKDYYFSGRAQVFYIKTKNLIVVNVHAPGIPDGFVQELWYKSISAFIRCGCPINQKKSLYCYPAKQNVRIILIGDFNVSDQDNLIEWTNEGKRKPYLKLFQDPYGRNTSYHSGIRETIEKEKKWKPDPNPYQKVDHLIHTLNLNEPKLNEPKLFVYVSNNFNRTVDMLLRNNISDPKRIIPYARNPALIMDAPNSDPKMDDGSVNPNYDIKNAAPLEEGKNVGDWKPNFDIGEGGWPSDHTFNLYVFPNIPDTPMRGGGSNKEIRRYKIVY